MLAEAQPTWTKRDERARMKTIGAAKLQKFISRLEDYPEQPSHFTKETRNQTSALHRSRSYSQGTRQFPNQRICKECPTWSLSYLKFGSCQGFCWVLSPPRWNIPLIPHPLSPLPRWGRGSNGSGNRTF